MDRRETLMIDMDDVMYTNGFLPLINNFLGTNYTCDEFKGFYMQDKIPNKDDFFEWFVTQNVYDYCDLMPYCYEVLEELNHQYDLFIATDYIWPEIARKCGYVLFQKFESLQRRLPFIDPRQYIFLANKSVLNMDIKIDDRIKNLDGASVKLLFSAYHNLEYSNSILQSMGIERMDGWLDIKRRLLRK